MKNVIGFLHGKHFTWLHRGLSKLFLGRMDYVIAQSRESLLLLQKIAPHVKRELIIGPYFDAPVIKTVSKTHAQKKLGLKGNVLLFFGFVRPYKGLMTLIEAMPNILSHTPVTLLIAGEFWQGKEAYVARARELKVEHALQIHDHFIPADHVNHYFAAADVVVVPYEAISQSAIIPTAFMHGVPVIATQVGGNSDWIDSEKNGILVPPKNPNALAEAVVHFYTHKLEHPFRRGVKQRVRGMRWDHAKENILLGRT